MGNRSSSPSKGGQRSPLSRRSHKSATPGGETLATASPLAQQSPSSQRALVAPPTGENQQEPHSSADDALAARPPHEKQPSQLPVDNNNAEKDLLLVTPRADVTLVAIAPSEDAEAFFSELGALCDDDDTAQTPDGDWMRFTQAMLLMGRDEYSSARNILEKIIARAPTSAAAAEARVALVQCHLLVDPGLTRAKLAMLIEILTVPPGTPPLDAITDTRRQELLAHLYMGSGERNPEAEAFFLDERHLHGSESWFQQALHHHRCGDISARDRALEHVDMDDSGLYGDEAGLEAMKVDAWAIASGPK